MKPRQTLTYSTLRRWHTCQRQYYWRVVRELSPGTSKAMNLGSVVHSALEAIESRQAWCPVIDEAFAQRAFDADQRRNHQIATAMVGEYERRYPRFQVVCLEREFEVPIRNPDSGWPSRSFVFCGKVDGVILSDRALWLLEHKTASNVDDTAYYERLWHDWQIALYVYALRASGINVDAVLYSVLGKPRIEQHPGETEFEFDVRRSTLKDPKRAKRKVPETDEEFGARLGEWYARPESLRRVEIPMRAEHIARAVAALWDSAKQILLAARIGYAQNLTACGGTYGQECPYAPICASGDSPMVVATYEHAPAHRELAPKEATQ